MAGAPTFNPGGIPDGPRRRTQASTKLLHEWASLQAWEVPPIYELRLGPTPLTTYVPQLSYAEEQMLRRWNRYADLIGIKPDEIDVIEAKMIADPGAISQLEYYVNLVRATPVLDQWPGRILQGVLLWAVDDPVIHQMATARGIRVVTYSPPWAAEYLAALNARRRRPNPGPP